MKATFTREPFTFVFAAGLMLFCGLAGCSSLPLVESRVAGRIPPSLRLTTHTGTVISFPADSWELTVSGIRGQARISGDDLPAYAADTTISYFEVASVDSRGENPWTQLLLTILGVVLVIGLAGVILYAAFRATER